MKLPQLTIEQEYQVLNYAVRKAMPYGKKEDLQEGEKIDNPLYKTNKYKNTFCVCMDDFNSYWIYKDDVRGESGRWFDFVMKKHKLKSYKEALEWANDKLELGLTLDCKVKEVKKDEIKKVQRWDIEYDKHNNLSYRTLRDEDFEYWKSSGITEKILLLYNVYLVDRYKMFSKKKDQIIEEIRTGSKKWYCYLYKQGAHIYMPEKKVRFAIGETPKPYVFGMEQLLDNDVLFFTGGQKDVMTLHSLGYSAICLTGENNTNIDEATLTEIKKRFKNIIVLYDRDSTGLDGSIELAQKYGFYRIVLPPLNGKDISDFVVEKGAIYVKEDLEKRIYTAINNLQGIEVFTSTTQELTPGDLANFSKIALDDELISKPLSSPKTEHEIFNYVINLATDKGCEFIEGHRDKFIVKVSSLANLFGLPLKSLLELLESKYSLSNFPKHEKKPEGIYSSYSNDFGKYKYIKIKKKDNVGQSFVNTQAKVGKTPFLPDRIFVDLPFPLNKMYEIYPGKSRRRDMLFLASIGVISSALENIYGYYDDSKLSPNIFLMNVGPPARDKSVVMLAQVLGTKIDEELMREFKTKEEEYPSKLKEWKKNKEEGANEPKPEQPSLQMLFIPPDNSASGAVEIIANNLNAVLLSQEADTLSRILANSEWGDWSPLLRQIYDHDPYRFYRRTNNEFINIPRARLSVVLCGTPDQVPKLIADRKNGLISRFIFYCFEDTTRFRNPFLKKRDTKIIIEEYAIYLQKLRQKLKGEYEKEFRFTPEQENQFFHAFDDWHQEVTQFVGNDTDDIVFRLGIAFFRIAMTLSVLRDHSKDVIYCKDIDFHITLDLINTLKHHSLAVLNLMPQQEETEKETNSIQQFYASLPDKFDANTATKIGKANEISRRQVFRYLNELVEEKKLKKIKMGVYQKVSGITGTGTSDTLKSE